MATPTVPQKRLLAYGAKKAATWGTAVALGALDGMLVQNIGSPKPSRPYLPAEEADTPFVKDGVLGPIDPVNINIAFDMRYDPTALGTLIALLFGTAGAPAQQGATAAYLHTFQWADNIKGKFAVVAGERANKIFEIASAKPTSLVFTISNGLLQGSLTLLGGKIIDDSSVNTATQMDALTYDDRYNRATFETATVKMNAESGGDVTSESALEINSLDVSYERPLDSEHIAGQGYVIEPQQNGANVLTVKMGFPRMSTVNDDFFQNFNDETEQKLLIQFTGALIETTYYYDMKQYFPRMRIVEVNYPDDSEIIPADITLQAEEAASNPTGMGHTRPYIELINKKTTDYLA